MGGTEGSREVAAATGVQFARRRRAQIGRADRAVAVDVGRPHRSVAGRPLLIAAVPSPSKISATSCAPSRSLMSPSMSRSPGMTTVSVVLAAMNTAAWSAAATITSGR